LIELDLNLSAELKSGIRKQERNSDKTKRKRGKGRMNDILFILKQAIGHLLTILCGFVIGIGMCKMCEFIIGLFESVRKRG